MAIISHELIKSRQSFFSFSALEIPSYVEFLGDFSLQGITSILSCLIIYNSDVKFS